MPGLAQTGYGSLVVGFRQRPDIARILQGVAPAGLRLAPAEISAERRRLTRLTLGTGLRGKGG
jgi:hypothetical protein